jgi:hypothetical protein
MVLYFRFSNGQLIGLECDPADAAAFVAGVATAAACLGAEAWVAGSLPQNKGVDNDSWLAPHAWIAKNR